MKKIFVIVSLMLMATAAMTGCGDVDNSTTNALPPQEYNKTFTLQGKIMDAVTGAPVGSDATGTLSVYLIQGDADRGPTKLHTAPNDPLLGEYSFSGIPADFVGNEVTYKVVVRRGGYQDFAANVTFNAASNQGTIVHNGTLNMIGNIYLYPLGASAGNVSVFVRSSNGITPIPNAAVLLQQNVANNGTTAITGNRLAAAGGLYTSLTATTDDNGLATFNSPDLTLGGNYVAVAQAMTFQDEELATTATTAFIVGTSSATQMINMTLSGNTLFATSASNQTGAIANTGILTITFNQAIVVDTNVFTATVQNAGAATAAVAAALDGTGRILTLTPAFNPAVTAANAGATIVYSYTGGISLGSNQASVVPAGTNLFNNSRVLNITTGNPLSGTVQLQP